MGVFRLTDVSNTDRELKSYWDARVTRDWSKPMHGTYSDASRVVAMDARNFRVLDAILEDMSSEPRVLECACGYGRYAEHITDYTSEYIGIDYADLNIIEARRRHAGNSAAEFFVADMATFAAGGKFDLIFMVAAYSSIEQRSAETIAHLKSLLNPGGKIAIFEETLYMVIDR